MANDIILDVKNLSLSLNAEIILDNLSFQVKKGQALAIIGPNGAGKTVLFKALLGLLPYQGEIKWQGKARIGYVPQQFSIDQILPITVQEFLLLKSDRFWLPGKEFIARLRQALNLLGLPLQILTKIISELSGGQLQRVLIAWAMLNQPEILLFDEPVSGIDAGFGEKIYTILRRLQEEQGLTLLVISHDLNIVYRYADEVLCLNKEMICHGRPREVLLPEELAKLYGESGFYHHSNKDEPLH